MNTPGLHISYADASLVALAGCISLFVAGLPVLLTVLFGWGATLDFYLTCSAAFAVLVYLEEGER